MRFGKKVIFLPSFWLLCRDTNSRKLNLYRHFQPSPKLTQGFPGGSSGKEPTCQCRRPNRQGFYPWIGKIPWKRVRQPTPVFLPGESHEQFSTQQAYISSIQSLSRVRLFVTPWTAAHQASLSITNSRSLPKSMSIESVMPSNHLILSHPLLLLPSIFPSIRVFNNDLSLHIKWPKYWRFNFNISPSSEY